MPSAGHLPPAVREEEDFQFKVSPLSGAAELTGPAEVIVRCRANYWPGSFLSDIGITEGPIVATRVESVTVVDSFGPDM